MATKESGIELNLDCEDIIEAVWSIAATTVYNSPDDWRKDACGAWIEREDYGNRHSEYGWEIDQIDPASKNEFETSNLRALQWQNKAAKSDDKMNCVIAAKGANNVHNC